jgi:Flp pilus assembly protein TadD
MRVFAQGDYKQAALLFGAALKERETAERWNDWATALIALGLVRPAEQGYRRALQLDPQRGDAASNLGLLLAATGRRAEAIPFLERSQPKVDAETQQRVAAVLAECRQAPAPPAR